MSHCSFDKDRTASVGYVQAANGSRCRHGERTSEVGKRGRGRERPQLGRSFLLVAVIYFVTVTTSALVFEFAEGKYDAVDSFWWAFTTATTTGYSDIYPVTKTGRAVALFLMHFGPGFAFPMMTAIMSAKLIVDSDAFTHGEQEQLKEDIAAIRGMMTPANEVGFAAAARLEADMRHYLHDEEPTRRAQCLDEFRQRLALAPWAEGGLPSDGDRGDELFDER